MILLEQYIELNIYHFHKLRKYDVSEILKDDEGMSFRIYYKGSYVFTLIPVIRDYLSFELSDTDKYMKTSVDWGLCSKIKASLYSVFLKDNPS